MAAYKPGSIQFQNREVFQRDRDKFLRQAVQKINNLIDNFETIHAAEDGPETLLQEVEALVNDLKEARYFGFRGLGGNPTNPPDFINTLEISAVDHIVVIYYAALSMVRYLRHECLVRAFERDSQIEDDHLLNYIQQVIMNDRKIILTTLRSVKERMEIYQNYAQTENQSNTAEDKKN